MIANKRGVKALSHKAAFAAVRLRHRGASDARVDRAGDRRAGGRGGETGGDRSGRVEQPCRYKGITCGGCGKPVELGETMVSVGHCLSHSARSCVAFCEVAVAELAQHILHEVAFASPSAFVR